MFDIGWSELLLIGVVALIAIGPKELPGVLRAVGQWTGKIRRMAAEFQGQFQEALREAEMADLKKQVDELQQAARSATHFDPLAEPAKPAPAAATPEATVTAAVETVPVESAPIPPVAEEPAAPQPLAVVEPVGAAAATASPLPEPAPAQTEPEPAKPEEGRPA